jgi:type II secretory pathway component PulC
MDDTRRAVLLALAATIILSIAFSSVFVYYPITAQISPVSPPVILDSGSNAGKSDLSGSNTIGVIIGDNKTSATITIHPTYQTSYYENVTIIRNKDSKSYNVTLKVYTAVSDLPSGSKVLLYLFSKGATRSLSGWPSSNLAPSGSLAVLDLTQTTTSDPVTLSSSGSIVEVDILVYIPEGSTMPTSPVTAKIYLVYTPSG